VALDDLKKEVAALKSKAPEWPAGSYCIWKSGACPPGFKALAGSMGSNLQWPVDIDQAQAVKIGESSIKISKEYPRYGVFVAMDLAACCKD